MGQSVSATHSTHWLRAVSHTNPMSEHSRDERQVGGRATHTLLRQRSVSAQSTSASQSTQYPSRVLHTCRGHIRDDVHGTGVKHRLARQMLPGAMQSLAPLHSTQRPAMRSHTSPRALHSRSEAQRTVEASGASAGVWASTELVASGASSAVASTTSAVIVASRTSMVLAASGASIALVASTTSSALATSRPPPEGADGEQAISATTSTKNDDNFIMNPSFCPAVPMRSGGVAWTRSHHLTGAQPHAAS